MMETFEKDGIEATLHVGATDNRVVVTLAVTNTNDETWTSSSGMGAWSEINIVDENGLPRMESMASTAVVTPWEIPPGCSLVSVRETDTRDEALDKEEEISSEHLQYDADTERFANQDSEFKGRYEEGDTAVFYAHNVSLPEENDVKFTAKGTVKLDGFNPELDVEFTPSELSEPLDVEEEFTLAKDEGGGSMNFGRF